MTFVAFAADDERCLPVRHSHRHGICWCVVASFCGLGCFGICPVVAVPGHHADLEGDGTRVLAYAVVAVVAIEDVGVDVAIGQHARPVAVVTVGGLDFVFDCA